MQISMSLCVSVRSSPTPPSSLCRLGEGGGGKVSTESVQPSSSAARQGPLLLISLSFSLKRALAARAFFGSLYSFVSMYS